MENWYAVASTAVRGMSVMLQRTGIYSRLVDDDFDASLQEPRCSDNVDMRSPVPLLRSGNAT